MPDIGWSEWLSMMTSLAVVLALLGVTLFALKKMGLSNGKAAANVLQIDAVHNLGPRQKLILVSVNGDQVLLGVTPHSINRLANWTGSSSADDAAQFSQPQSDLEGPVSDCSEETDSSVSGGMFKQLLSQVHDRSADGNKS